MSVYTHVSEQQLRAFLQPLGVGELIAFQGIEGGVVNSNFFVDTGEGAFVLTLFEDLESEDLPFFVQLNDYLAERGLPCARPARNANGEAVFELNGRPACLFTRLPGHHVQLPAPAECRAMGAALGRMHTEVEGFPMHRRDDRALDWFAATIDVVVPRLDGEKAALIRSEWEWQTDHPLAALPSGIIHADLFRDNILFESGQLSGIIDFYFACDGVFVYDLAITLNDWCLDERAAWGPLRREAFMAGYGEQRCLSPEEKRALPGALRLAALRFWLSRLQESLFPAEGELVLIKDPSVFERILLASRNESEMTISQQGWS